MSDDDQPTIPLGLPGAPDPDDRLRTEPHDTVPYDTVPYDATPHDATPHDTLPLGQPQSEANSAPVSPAAGPWATDAAVLRGPRIRWAGVVWGALFCAFGVVVMSVLSTTANRIAFTAWVDGLGPGGGTLLGVAALGALLLVLGVVAAAGRAQRRP